ncbi:DUF3127 domain-containing protein [Rubritalea spongiae]|uniref:DUF3127 domain-containing protein n=1 Tax=Rubritalea spongiae TaxID=430797 RepID=A0ABW5E135_9BACT
MFEISGKIKLIDDTQTFSSGFTKREFVVTTGDKYPQDIKFETVKDKCAFLDNFSVGQEVNVNFDIRGNEYNGRYYVNLNCWKIQAASGQSGQQSAPQKEPNFDNPFGNQQEPSAADLRSNLDDGDDIPF